METSFVTVANGISSISTTISSFIFEYSSFTSSAFISVCIFVAISAGSSPRKLITIVFLSVISASIPGVTTSFFSSTIWFSSNISDTLVFDVNTVISWLFENFIFTLFSLTFPPNTTAPSITTNIILKNITFLILLFKIIIPP